MENKLPFSYHTFLFPFRLSKTVSEENTTNWERNTITKTKITSTGDKYISDYSVYQYMIPEARNLLFDTSSDPEDCDEKYDYCYKLPPNTLYSITKEGKTFNLIVKEIRLLILDNNVGILALATENHSHAYIQDIKEINEYGRRIIPPFLSKVWHPLIADKISLLGKSVDFKSLQKTYIDKAITPTDSIIDPIRAIIEDFVGVDNRITPVIDDRMFVCCLIRYEPLSSMFKENNSIYSNEYLYSIGFIDAGDATCQSPSMRKDILSRCIYDRWRDWGTIDIITHHSFMRLTGVSEYIKDSVITPFITEYVDLAIGALIQRATIMTFLDQCSDLSREISYEMKRNKCISKSNKNAIEHLNAEFVDAQSRIFLDQLSAQEQGVEEFDMLRNELYIQSTLDSLSKKVESLYKLTGIYTEQEENSLLNLIAFLGIPIALIDIAISLYSECAGNSFSAVGVWTSLILGALIGVIPFVIRPLLRRFKRNK